MTKRDDEQMAYGYRLSVRRSEARDVLNSEDDYTHNDELQANQYSRTVCDSQGNTLFRF